MLPKHPFTKDLYIISQTFAFVNTFFEKNKDFFLLSDFVLSRLKNCVTIIKKVGGLIMKKIYFRNSMGWKTVFAVLFDKNEKNKQQIRLDERCENGDYVLDFDNEKFDHLYFEGDLGKKTSKIYPGAISIGVEYKYNENMNRSLTYLFSEEIAETGRVDNYVLEDETNLSYRDDKSKKISVFVPATYDGNTPHDILYFFDAQNLFCGAGNYRICAYRRQRRGH